MTLWDQATGNEREPMPRRRPPSPARKQEPSVPAPEHRHQRPEGVSDNVWNLAQFWMQKAEETFGSRPPVNLRKFAVRLNEVVQNDRLVQELLTSHPDPERCDRRVRTVLEHMVKLFFEYGTEVGDEGSPAVQFKFLRDEWDYWIDMAHTSIRVKHSRPYTGPQPRRASPEEMRERERAVTRVKMRQIAQEVEAAKAQSKEKPHKTFSGFIRESDSP